MMSRLIRMLFPYGKPTELDTQGQRTYRDDDQSPDPWKKKWIQ